MLLPVQTTALGQRVKNQTLHAATIVRARDGRRTSKTRLRVIGRHHPRRNHTDNIEVVWTVFLFCIRLISVVES